MFKLLKSTKYWACFLLLSQPWIGSLSYGNTHVFILLGKMNSIAAEKSEKARDLSEIYQSAKAMKADSISILAAKKREVPIITKYLLNQKVSEEVVKEIQNQIKVVDSQTALSMIKNHSVKPGDRIFVVVIAHGYVSSDLCQMEQAGIGWNTLKKVTQKISWKSLADSTSVHSEHAKVIWITASCFGGAVHSIPRMQLNTCSFSTVPVSEMGKGVTKFKESSFISHFCKLLPQSKMTFFRSWVQSAEKDLLNLGTNSFFDYVDFILKAGPYRSDHIKYSLLEIDDPLDKVYREERVNSELCDIYLNSFSLPRPEFAKFQSDPKVLSLEYSNHVDRILNEDEEFLDQFEKKGLPDNEIQNFPSILVELFKESFSKKKSMVEQVKKIKLKYSVEFMKGLDLYDTRLNEIFASGSLEKEKDFDLFWNAYQRQLSMRLSLVFKVKESPSEYPYLHIMIERYHRLVAFMKEATEGEKKKAYEILALESELNSLPN